MIQYLQIVIFLESPTNNLSFDYQVYIFIESNKQLVI